MAHLIINFQTYRNDHIRIIVGGRSAGLPPKPGLSRSSADVSQVRGPGLYYGKYRYPPLRSMNCRREAPASS